MRKIMLLTLTIASLVASYGKKASSDSQNNIEYFYPGPNVQVVEVAQPPKQVEPRGISYCSLVDLVNLEGGRVELDLLTTEVGRDKETGGHFKGNGYVNYDYGYAWANQMQGTIGEDILVSLSATEVGRDKETGGHFKGNGYVNYGYANVKRMVGCLGDELDVEYVCSEVKRDKETDRRVQGNESVNYDYGYAWANKGKLVISFREEER